MEVVEDWVKNRNTDSLKLIIESHIPIIYKVCRKYCGVFPHKRDDIVGEALLALVLAAKEAPDKMVDLNITQFIISKVCWAIRDFIRSDAVIYTPKTCKRVLTQVDLELIQESIGLKSHTTLECDCIIKLLHTTTRELIIINMLLEGYTQKEISRTLGLSPSVVNHEVQCIRQRATSIVG